MCVPFGLQESHFSWHTDLDQGGSGEQYSPDYSAVLQVSRGCSSGRLAGFSPFKYDGAGAGWLFCSQLVHRTELTQLGTVKITYFFRIREPPRPRSAPRPRSNKRPRPHPNKPEEEEEEGEDEEEDDDEEEDEGQGEEEQQEDDEEEEGEEGQRKGGTRSLESATY